MPFQVSVTGSGQSFSCREDQTVLAAMSLGGARCVQIGCRSGGCGVCRVQVESGAFETGQMSYAQVDAQDRARGIVLACQLFPRTDLRLRVLGRPEADVNASTAELLRRLSLMSARNERSAA